MKPVPHASQSSETIYKASVRLLENYHLKNNVRLIGVSVSGLVSEETPVQIPLFKENEDQNENWEKIDEVVDQITRKFGKPLIKKASLKAGKPPHFPKKNEKK